jgi:hypothetical protein
MKKQTKLFSWNLIVLGIITIFLLGLTLVNLISTIYLLLNSEKTTGTIQKFVEICGGESCNMCPEISYISNDGSNHTFVSGSCGFFTRNYFEGQSLEIIYNSNITSHASINSFVFIWGYTIFILFLAIVFSTAFVATLRKNLNKN